MTSAKDDLRAVIAERFGEDVEPLEEVQPDAGRATSRARFIATVHALLAYLQAHPSIPVPWSIGINVRVPDVETLRRVAADLGVEPFPRDRPDQINVFDPVGQEHEFYTPIAISVDDRDDKRPL